MKSFSLIVVLVVTLFYGCESSTELKDEVSNRSVIIITDKQSYLADTSTTITVSVINNLPSTIYYLCEGSIFLKELKNGLVTNSWKVHGFKECLATKFIDTTQKVTFQIKFSTKVLDNVLENVNSMDNPTYYFEVFLYKNIAPIQQLESTECSSNQFKLWRLARSTSLLTDGYSED